jgi:hypothetical protein
MSFRPLVLALGCVVACQVSHAADADLAIPSFKSLEHVATDSVNIDLGPGLLHLMGSFMNPGDVDSVAAKTLLTGIRAVQVRNFEFATDFVYPGGDLDALRRQLSGPGWTQLVLVHNRQANENVDVYINVDKGATKGFALIATRPRQLTVIHIAGSIELSELAALERSLHIPETPVAPPAVL